MKSFSTKESRGLIVLLGIIFLTLHFYIKHATLPKTEFSGAKKGETVGSFEGKTLDDQNINLADVAKNHKLIVINFWETWCGPCKTELPYLQKIYAENKDRGLEIIAVYENSTLESVNDMIKKNSLTYSMVHDQNKSITKQFKVIALPTTIVTDQNLKVLRSHEGIDLGLRDFIASRLKEEKK